MGRVTNKVGYHLHKTIADIVPLMTCLRGSVQRRMVMAPEPILEGHSGNRTRRRRLISTRSNLSTTNKEGPKQ